MEYQVGDYLVHEGSGVCQIDDIADMELMGKGSKKTYYCMHPVFKASAKVFTPLDGASLKLRPVTSAAEFAAILDSIDSIELIHESNDRLRQEAFKSVMAEFTVESLIRVVKTALVRKWARLQAGKKVMAQDEKVLALAGRKLYEEMAFAMDQDLAVVQQLFEEKVGERADELMASAI